MPHKRDILKRWHIDDCSSSVDESCEIRPVKMMILALLLNVAIAHGFLTDVPRQVVKEISVTNGMGWGAWGSPQFCALGSYANGYSMQIEANQHGADDTELNSISLHCVHKDTGVFGGDITSTTGLWGTWGPKTYCDPSGPHEKNSFLKSFSLQVEGNQHGGDDTAANFIKFKCRDMMNTVANHEISALPGHGDYGSYAGWSEECDQGSAICGIKTRVEGDQRGGDDTALNNVIFYCCSD